MGNTNDEYYAKLRLREEYEKEKAYYTELKGKLEECKENIGNSLDNIRTGVEEPITAPYDLSAGGELWRGSNYDTAVTDADAIGQAVKNYDGAVDRLLGRIQDAIDQVQEKIDEIDAKIAALGI